MPAQIQYCTLLKLKKFKEYQHATQTKVNKDGNLPKVDLAEANA